MSRCESDGYFIPRTPSLITQHLILIDHKQIRTCTFCHISTLGFKSSNQNGRFRAVSNIASYKTNIPTPFSPVSEFVVGQSPGGNGVDSLSFPTGFNELFEDKSFPCSRWSMQNNIFSVPQIIQRPALPRVRKGKCLTKLTGVHLHLSTFSFHK